MGNVGSKKLKKELTELKAEMLAREAEHEAEMQKALRKREAQLKKEKDAAVEKERVAAEEELENLRMEKKVLKLRNEVLTEMVATEQVAVKLQQKRTEALKWELLRRGGTKEELDTLTAAAPEFAQTLSLSSTMPGPLNLSGTYDMSDAVEKMTQVVRKMHKDLLEAFEARDKGRAGKLGAPEFKDALKEVVPELPREDRQLLALRFLHEDDSEVDYLEFMDFFKRKIAVRRWKEGGGKLGLTASKSMGHSSNTASAIASMVKQLKGQTSPRRASRQGVGRRTSAEAPPALGSGPPPKVSEEDIEAMMTKMRALVVRKRPEFVDLFDKADRRRTGFVRKKQLGEIVLELADDDTRPNRTDRVALYEAFSDEEGLVDYLAFLEAFPEKSKNR